MARIMTPEIKRSLYKISKIPKSNGTKFRYIFKPCELLEIGHTTFKNHQKTVFARRVHLREFWRTEGFSTLIKRRDATTAQDLRVLESKKFLTVNPNSALFANLIPEEIVGGVAGRHVTEIPRLAYKKAAVFKTDIKSYFRETKRPAVIKSMAYVVKKEALILFSSLLTASDKFRTRISPQPTILQHVSPDEIVFSPDSLSDYSVPVIDCEGSSLFKNESLSLGVDSSTSEVGAALLHISIYLSKLALLCRAQALQVNPVIFLLILLKTLHSSKFGVMNSRAFSMDKVSSLVPEIGRWTEDGKAALQAHLVHIANYMNTIVLSMHKSLLLISPCPKILPKDCAADFPLPGAPVSPGQRFIIRLDTDPTKDDLSDFHPMQIASADVPKISAHRVPYGSVCTVLDASNGSHTFTIKGKDYTALLADKYYHISIVPNISKFSHADKLIYLDTKQRTDTCTPNANVTLTYLSTTEEGQLEVLKSVEIAGTEYIYAGDKYLYLSEPGLGFSLLTAPDNLKVRICTHRTTASKLILEVGSRYYSVDLPLSTLTDLVHIFRSNRTELCDFTNDISYWKEVEAGILTGYELTLDLMTSHTDGLPEGTRTSPVLANYVATYLADSVSKDLASLGGHVRVYVDDWTVILDQAPDTEVKSKIISVIKKAFSKLNLHISPEKTKFILGTKKREVFGITFLEYDGPKPGVTIRLARGKSRNLRAKIHNLKKYAAVYLKWMDTTGLICPSDSYIKQYFPKGYDRLSHLRLPHTVNVLRGEIAWAVSVSHNKYSELYLMFENIVRDIREKIYPKIKELSYGLIDMAASVTKAQIREIESLAAMMSVERSDKI